MIHKVIFWGLCAVLVFVPLPLGMTENWAIFVFEASTLLLFFLYILGKRSSSKVEKDNSQVSRIPILFKILLGVFIGISVFHLIPFPQTILKILSPQTHNIYSGVFSGGMNELGELGWKTLTFSSALSVYEVVKYICFFLFFYLVFKCVRTRREIETFVLVFLFSAVFQSVYGLTEYFGGTERIFGYKKEWGLGSATGTYINRNHFAGFLEMIFPISVCYLLVKANFFDMKKGLSIKEKILWFGQEQLQKSIVFGSISILLGIGIFFSRSRSGIFIFFISLFLLVIVLFIEGRKNTEIYFRKKRFRRIILSILLVILFSAVLIGIKPIIERFSWDRLAHAERPIIFRNTIDLIQIFPLFGTGLGTYVYVYPMFEKGYSSVIMDHAHNDYLEFLSESGLVGGGSLILLSFWSLGFVFVKWRKRRDAFVKGVGLGCILAIVAILIHSMSDFNLQIPANAVYFVTIYALAINAVSMKRSEIA